MSNIGEDFLGHDDLDPSLTIVSGRLALLHALAGRFSSDKGSLKWADDPSYGYNLTKLIGTNTPAAVIELGIEQQCLEDERVEAVRAVVSTVREGGHGKAKLSVELTVTDAQGTFTRTLLVSDLTVEILEDA